MANVKFKVSEKAIDGGNFHVKLSIEGEKQDIMKVLRAYSNE
jgi:hypothetical protein